MKETGRMTRLMAEEYTFTRMEQDMRENGWRTNSMVKVGERPNHLGMETWPDGAVY